MNGSMNGLLITGTDTNVGKTVLITALFAYLQKYASSQSTALFKPFQSGEGDRELYQRLFTLNQTPEDLNPVYFSAPFAPPIAAEYEGKTVAIDRAWTTYQALNQRYDRVLVEGVGGLGSPVTAESTVADLAWDWRIPVILVVPVQLGAIGQAVAHVALAERSRLHLKGIIRSCITPDCEEEVENWASQTLIERLTGVPVLGTLPHIHSLENLDLLAQAASQLDLELFLPHLTLSR